MKGVCQSNYLPQPVTVLFVIFTPNGHNLARHSEQNRELFCN